MIGGPPLRPLVLAAGLGQRLRPLTLTQPKPLVPVCGRPVVEPLLEWLADSGLRDVAINSHWLPDVLRDHLGDGSRLGVTLHWQHEPELREGAGTLKSFEQFLGEATALVVNGDCVLDIDLAAAVAAHRAAGSVLTLVCAPVMGPLARPVSFDESGWLRGIRRYGLDDPRGSQRAEFIGVHLVEPEVWRRHIPRGKRCNLVADVIPRLLARGLPVAVHVASGLFCDIGDIDSLQRAARLVLDRRPARYLRAAQEVSFGVWCEPGAQVLGQVVPPVYLGAGARLAQGARLGPYAVLPAGCTLPAGAFLAYGVGQGA
ncbi:MAG: NDP-sugar synthase [Armatimonadetes bacterium]|nr:NDP-sugar synthase [Armatimonadota bacterium]